MKKLGTVICLALGGHKVYDMERERMTTIDFQTVCYEAEFDATLCTLTFRPGYDSDGRYMSVRPDLFALSDNVSQADYEVLRALTDRIESNTDYRQTILDEIPHLNKYDAS